MDPKIFTATYRIQLRAEFGFLETEKIIQYLVELGISHLYTSPYVQAQTGSTHGYDVVNPNQINEELGGQGGLNRLCDALEKANLGQIVDIVPDHMSIAAIHNPWWWDVLENGPASRYASFFDVDWEFSQERWPNKILLPILDNHYGRVLENNQIELIHQKGIFALKYKEHILPIDPSSIAQLLARFADSCKNNYLAFLAQCYSHLPKPTSTTFERIEIRHRDKHILSDLVFKFFNENPDIERLVALEIAAINTNPDLLDSVIEQQNYRLAFWRTAARDLGYRRFFDVQDLVGLNIENDETFYSVHKLALQWIQNGTVQGLRIDHPDGLKNPTKYFTDLHKACPNTLILAEKILAANEKLPSNWPISGTTGYDFLNLVDALFIDPHGKKSLSTLYDTITAQKHHFDDIAKACKRHVLTELLDSEINRLTTMFVHICEQHRRHRDYVRYDLREALIEVAVCFPVYRTYVTLQKPVREEDKAVINRAIDHAIKGRSDLDPELFLFLKEILLLTFSGRLETEFAFRFQQLTPPTMGKGIEDTFFYRYLRLVSLNEVGGNPDHFGISAERFHRHCSQALLEHPFSMLTTTTHDTKRSEGVRMRLALLSEMPAEWSERVQKWYARPKKYSIDANTEYLFYQTLVGAWPITIERMTNYMQKAIREAKVETSWSKPHELYEKKVINFIKEAYHDKKFLNEMEQFVSSLLLPGRINSLSQTLIKLTAPGIPDIYQGSELWNLTLVDPDNRQPIDYELRQKFISELKSLSIEQIIERMDEGLPKLWLIQQTLHVRKNHPEHFSIKASYKPLYAHGKQSEHILAFMRNGNLLTVIPRLTKSMQNGWEDTYITLGKTRWRNILTNEEMNGELIFIKELFKSFPVALLQKL